MIFSIGLVVIGAFFALWPDALARIARVLYPLTQNPGPSPATRRAWYFRGSGVLLAAVGVLLLVASR